jgi:hypothetical protein
MHQYLDSSNQKSLLNHYLELSRFLGEQSGKFWALVLLLSLWEKAAVGLIIQSSIIQSSSNEPQGSLLSEVGSYIHVG